MKRVLLALPLLLLPAAGRAQDFRVEVAPTVGWRSAATLDDSGSGASYDVEAATSWGAVADVSVGRGLYFEVAWTRQESRTSLDDAFGPGLHDVTLDSFLLGGQWCPAPRARVRPFLSALVGATRLDAPGSAVTRLTAALGGGVKVMANETFGLRLEARGIAVFSGGSGSGLCGPSGCTIGLSGRGALQADLSGGVLLAF